MQVDSQWLFVGAVFLFTLTAAVTDLRTRRLPNWLTVPALAAALVFHSATGGLAGLGTAVAGFALGFGVLLVLWLIGGGGGGDVKLMGALGAWLGPTSTLLVFFASTVFAVMGTAGLATLDLLNQGYGPTRAKYVPARAGHPQRGKAPTPEARASRRVMPYAAPVALATWLVLVWRCVQ